MDALSVFGIRHLDMPLTPLKVWTAIDAARTDMEAAASVVALLEEHRRPGWVDLHNFRVIQFGRTLHIDCHVTLPWYLTLERAHEEIASIERLVNDMGDRRVELFIHMDPCIPSSCSICSLEGCPERKTAQRERLGNAKHSSA